MREGGGGTAGCLRAPLCQLRIRCNASRRSVPRKAGRRGPPSDNGAEATRAAHRDNRAAASLASAAVANRQPAWSTGTLLCRHGRQEELGRVDTLREGPMRDGPEADSVADCVCRLSAQSPGNKRPQRVAPNEVQCILSIYPPAHATTDRAKLCAVSRGQGVQTATCGLNRDGCGGAAQSGQGGLEGGLNGAPVVNFLHHTFVSFDFRSHLPEAALKQHSGGAQPVPRDPTPNYATHLFGRAAPRPPRAPGQLAQPEPVRHLERRGVRDVPVAAATRRVRIGPTSWLEHK